MDRQMIYCQLTAAGMTPAGAAGLMGNMQCESGMRANNAQDCYGRDDVQYTADVDSGEYTVFARDAVGYGLCQWTYHTRKAALLAYAQSQGTSIGDENMQVRFAVQELQSGYPALWAYLCKTDDWYEAARRVCVEYEQPAVNNIAVRAGHAKAYFETYNGTKIVPNLDTMPSPEVSAPELPTVKLGDKSAACAMLQGALIYHLYAPGMVDGCCGAKTAAALLCFNRDHDLGERDVCGAATWAELIKG